MADIKRPKQVSEMDDAELAAYKEPGAEEGDWMDYIPMGSLRKNATMGIKKISKGYLDLVKKKASDKALADAKVGKGNYEAIKYPQKQEGGQDLLKNPVGVDRPSDKMWDVSKKFAGNPSPEMAPAAPGKFASMAEEMPARSKRKRAEEEEEDYALPPEDISGGY